MKDNRKFIWGIFLLLLCGTGAAIGISRIIDGTCQWFNLILLAGNISGVIMGIINITKSI